VSSPLSAGDRVVVVAPAGPVQVGLLAAGVAVLRSWGLDVEVAPHVELRDELGYLAGDDAARAKDFQQAWCDPAVRAVVCARGGYGCLRVVDLLDWDAVAAAGPKVFAGSSDVTTLHAEFAARVGLPTLFAPMPATRAFVFDPITQEHLRRALFEPWAVLTGPTAVTMVPGRARGITAGGTVSLLAAGAPMPPPGAIALLEDVGEEPYRLDRILTQLLRSGWFDEVAGIALGSWTGCGDVTGVLADRLGRLGVPIIAELGFGHCPGQLTMPLGVEVELDADAATVTIIDEGSCR
jgi:muramoyltetrapeptide carboxypeptidase